MAKKPSADNVLNFLYTADILTQVLLAIVAAGGLSVLLDAFKSEPETDLPGSAKE